MKKNIKKKFVKFNIYNKKLFVCNFCVYFFFDLAKYLKKKI